MKHHRDEDGKLLKHDQNTDELIIKETQIDENLISKYNACHHKTLQSPAEETEKYSISGDESMLLLFRWNVIFQEKNSNLCPESNPGSLLRKAFEERGFDT